MIDPQTEASLFRDQVLTRFYARIDGGDVASAPPESSNSAQGGASGQAEPLAWDAEMALWAFASSTCGGIDSCMWP